MIVKRKTLAGRTRYGVRVGRGGGEKVWMGTFDTLAEARRAEAEAVVAEPKSKAVTCEDFVRRFLEHYGERRKDSSYDTARASLRRFVDDFKGRPLGAIEASEAEEWARANPWRVPLVVTMFNAAVRKREVEHNPFSGLSRKGPGRRDDDPLTEEEVYYLAGCAERAHGAYGPTVRAFVLFTAGTGMRPGEVYPLEWSDIDFERRRVWVRRRVYRGRLDTPKSSKAREIVLPPMARDALLALPRVDELVFTAKRGGMLSQPLVTGYFSPISALFGRTVHRHELRHFAAHHLYVTLDLPARVVAAQLGHSSPRLVEELYGHFKVGALQELDRALEAKVAPLRGLRVADGTHGS